MRCADWLKGYKQKYDYFLHTGNPATDASNAILLHTEGNGSQLPSLFVVENAEAQAAKPEMPVIPDAEPSPQVSVMVVVNGQAVGPCDWAKLQQMKQQGQFNPQTMVWKNGLPAWVPASQLPELSKLFAPVMPVMPKIPGMPDMPGIPGMPAIEVPEPDPVVQVMVAVNGQPQGPKDWVALKQMVQMGQLTTATMVWMQGLPAWTPAGQVPQLSKLFSGSILSGMPGMPGMPSL